MKRTLLGFAICLTAALLLSPTTAFGDEAPALQPANAASDLETAQETDAPAASATLDLESVLGTNVLEASSPLDPGCFSGPNPPVDCICGSCCVSCKCYVTLGGYLEFCGFGEN